MSQHESSKNTGTTIKIAPKEASQRNSGGGADPGPGDEAAAPSVAPELVDIPAPPTPSELVVKSADAGSAPRTGPKSVIMSHMGSKSHSQLAKSSASASQMGPAASNKSAPREPTSSSKLTGPTGPPSAAENSVKSRAGGNDASSAVFTSGGGKSGITGGPRSPGSRAKSANSMGGAPKSGTSVGGAPKSGTSVGGAPKSGSSVGGAYKSASGGPMSATGGPVGSPASQGAVHDVDEEGEGEMEHPDEGPSPATTPGGLSGLRGSSAVSTSNANAGGSNMGHSPASDGAGFTKLSTRTSGHKSASPVSSDASSGLSSGKDKKKKVTKFRYHKRITVRTSGKTSPSSIMDKVNKKDHQARITPSTIEDMDPAELMKRAGISPTNKTHWRVRLRQTKRVTKDGKTSTQTKVAYRDSEGNKRVKTSLSPYCQKCGKKLEECKCDPSQS